MERKEKLFSLTDKDFKFQFFRSSGNGGQHRNTTDSAARCIHIETGLFAECCDERHQLQNKKIAFQRLTSKPEFQKWLRMKAAEMMGQIPTEEQVKEKVEDWMRPENLKVEFGK